ncbi:leucine zipper transcription factor-like protein 1 isoform X1 [Magallana gigas]|uniref:leucine zipper transcription factor-like protein 1 isoform X1 n=1 Tax=Magallana gigas TaxID=29159 RepID=UPI0005C38189|eukprot:XP_011413648.1 PREDICTED: leucine zipper transcription factor-like protein 1 isoform X2 [Crassostrea gigas]
MSKLGVNEHHQAQVVNYMRFSRYQRGQRLRAVEMCFEELKSSRLDETTYTIDEVTEMLDGLLSVVRGEVEGELDNTAYTNVLLLRQMFQQAEKWHLKLQADISELENRELIETIADFEEREFAGTTRDTDFNSVLRKMKLAPINESGGAALLHMKIEELEKENLKLSEQRIQLEKQVKSLGGSVAVSAAASSVAGGSNQNDGEVNDLRKKLASLESDLDSTKRSSANSSNSMEKDLVSTKHELLKIKEMLEMAEKELEKKVSQTNPFKNLKQMLVKKNDQLKELRKRLSKYEKVDDAE